ncbi:hypothetical protein [Halocatena marina]|uniref:ATP synthase F0 subunit 8 n=1 Tax=Halocatena marina TaxID=2934937 RepID=A0ABD5YQX8_9EURY|nr:hypothetical protein [Halocatena marina]
MVADSLLVYFGAGTLLFFFWAYGIVSFALDMKNKIIPSVKQYRRGRRRLAEEKQQEQERKKDEQQLY